MFGGFAPSGALTGTVDVFVGVAPGFPLATVVGLDWLYKYHAPPMTATSTRPMIITGAAVLFFGCSFFIFSYRRSFYGSQAILVCRDVRQRFEGPFHSIANSVGIQAVLIEQKFW